MIAYCGLACDTCPIHLATSEPDRNRQQMLRESVIRRCAEIYGMELRPEEITDCDGCRSGSGRIFSGCLHCEIRKCALGKKIDSCACCIQYPCKLLDEHFSRDPGSRTNLERLRNNS